MRQILVDFLYFANLQFVSQDYDPFHSTLRYLEKDMDQEEALWMSYFYMAFYNLGSAYAAFQKTPVLESLPDNLLDLPIGGPQRRNLYAGKVGKNISSLIRKVEPYGSLFGFFTRDFTFDRKRNWFTLLDTASSVWGNGRWSTYTLCELLQKVNRLPVTPASLGNEGSSGPIRGLQLVMGTLKSKSKVDKIKELDDKGAELLEIIYKKLPKHKIDYANLESVLCDFGSLCKGRYYVGRDIDREQGRILQVKTKKYKVDLALAWKARKKALAEKYLGELNDWIGIDRERLLIYKETGKILDRNEKP